MDEQNDYFLQRLRCMRAECAEIILDDRVIQGDINNYNRYIERRKTIIEIIDLYLGSQKESEDTNRINSKFNGTTIV